MTIKESLHKLIASLYPEAEVQIDYVPRDKTGDYSTNLAMKLAPAKGRPPMAVAEEMAARLNQAASTEEPLIECVNVHPPGFVNITIRRDRFWSALQTSTDIPKIGAKRRVLVEFVSANPTGPINIVSARAAAFGDALVKILNATGHDAQTEYYINDSGRQIELLAASVEQRMLGLAGQPMQIPEEGYHGDYLIDVAEQARARGLSQHNDIKKFALEYFVEDHRQTMQSFGIMFNNWKRESQVRKNGAVEKALAYLKDKKLTFEQDGALFFRTTDFQDVRDRVIVTGDGRFTYLLPDIAYHLDKINRGFDRLITVLGPDHIGQVPSLIGGLQAFGHPRDILKVIIVQEVKLKKDGKVISMSKRAGTFTPLSELLEKIPADVARFFFLMRSCSQHLDFDLDLAMKESEENPVYYVQYAHARIQSLIAFGQEEGKVAPDDRRLDRLTAPEEMQLIKTVVKFGDVTSDAAHLNEPYLLTYYLIELARDFHFFYDRHRVVSDDPELTGARLFLANRTAATLKRGCELLGIGCPDSM